MTTPLTDSETKDMIDDVVKRLAELMMMPPFESCRAVHADLIQWSVVCNQSKKDASSMIRKGMRDWVSLLTKNGFLP